MIKITIIFLSYILIFFNTYLLSNENIGEIKIGLLAPFSGKYKNLGDSLLLSTQLALDEIGDKKIKIIPRDSGSDNKEKLNRAVKEIIDSGAKIILGPPDSSGFEELYKYNEAIFILFNSNSFLASPFKTVPDGNFNFWEFTFLPLTITS